MHWKSDMTVEEYLEYCHENRNPPRFRGIGPFQELLKQGRITPFITTIRIMYSGLLDQHYCLGDSGMLMSINYPDNSPQDPEEVLREDKYPEGWEIWSLKPKNFKE